MFFFLMPNTANYKCRLDDFFEIKQGMNISKSDFNNAGKCSYKVIQMSDIVVEEKELDLQKLAILSSDKALPENKLLSQNDYVITCKGANPKGKSILYTDLSNLTKDATDGLIINSHLISLTPKKSIDNIPNDNFIAFLHNLLDIYLNKFSETNKNLAKEDQSLHLTVKALKEVQFKISMQEIMNQFAEFEKIYIGWKKSFEGYLMHKKKLEAFNENQLYAII
jgi:hypothetical protein